MDLTGLRLLSDTREMLKGMSTSPQCVVKTRCSGWVYLILYQRMYNTNTVFLMAISCYISPIWVPCVHGTDQELVCFKLQRVNEQNDHKTSLDHVLPCIRSHWCAWILYGLSLCWNVSLCLFLRGSVLFDNFLLFSTQYTWMKDN